MKRIYIVRHAKSSWENAALPDHDRPLNDRGKNDAPFMAQKCFDLGYLPDQIITSTAKRALKTAKKFHTVLGQDISFRTESKLYHAPSSTYFEECYGLEESTKSVMLFGHNPGITYLANEIHGDYVDNVPTCGILVIDVHVKFWNEVEPTQCYLEDFLYPKKYR